MKNLTLIAAIGKNGELGKDNQLIWRIPEDMKFFKSATINKPIVMGINTLNSLPKLLPNRKHIVLTHREVELSPEIMVVHNMEDLLKYIQTLNEEVMVIGGAQVYSQMIKYADKMLLTEIEESAPANVFFPNIDMDIWKSELLSEHQYNDIKYRRLVYRRK